MRIIYLLIAIIFLNGCAEKEVIKYKYIYPPLPTLKTYEYNKTLKFGNVYNKKNKVCIIKWNTCIPKNEFKKIVNTILELKEKNNKLNLEIINYNNFTKNYTKETR